MTLFAPAHVMLEAKLSAFRPSPLHFVADLALRGLLLELKENALVAASIARGALPHRAYPSARAAFEACQLSLLLATAEDYDLEGAKAWVHYLRKDAELARAHGDSQSLDGMTPDQWLSAATNEMADTWDSLSSGKGALVRQAEQVLRKKPRKPDNWAGVSLGRELGRRLEKNAKQRGTEMLVANHGDAHNRAYAALSRGAHPRPSLRPERVSLSDGHFEITMERRDVEADRDTVDALLAGALNFGSSAVNVRLAMNAA